MRGEFVIHPTIWSKDGWRESCSTKQCLPLTEKYNEDIQKELFSLCSHDGLDYAKPILTEFQDKCRITHQKGIKGIVNISYAFLDPRLPEAVMIMKNDCNTRVSGQPVSIVHVCT